MLGYHLKQSTLKTAAWLGSAMVGKSSPPARLENFHRILVFQAGGIGDILRIFPLLESMHTACPESELFTLSPFHTTVFDLLPHPNIIRQSLGYNPTSDHHTFKAKLQLVRALRDWHFDLIVNPARGQGMLQNSLLSYAFGAPFRVGFDDAGAGFANNIRVRLLPNRPIVQQNLNLLRALGIEPNVEHIHLRVPQAEQEYAETTIARVVQGPKSLIAIHPGSTWQSRLQWRLPRYVEVISSLLQQHSYTILLLGTPPETSLGEAIMQQLDSARVVNLIGKTSLLQVAALLSRCTLFIGNDSGLLHIALGLGTPSIGLFGYTDPQQVICPEGPCKALHHPEDADLYLHQPFFTFDSAKPNPIDNIQVNDVLEAAKSLLLGGSLSSGPRS